MSVAQDGLHASDVICMGNRSIDFFESQFRCQIAERDLVLNPFE
jgi:hypothetical protein